MVVALLVALIVAGSCAETFTVPTGSMRPTLDPGDRVVVCKVGAQPVRRGQVVVFDATDAFGLGTLSNGVAGWLRRAGDTFGIRTGEIDYVKRVVATGGDRVGIGSDDVLRVNGVAVSEPYLGGGTASGGQPFQVRVPPGSVFVLGDDRRDSDDSRAHLGSAGGGMVPTSDIVGRVCLRYWPTSSWGTLSG